MAPSASPELVRRIQKAAGKRLGHDVQPRWDPFAERWIIFAFDKHTGRVDYPYHLVQNPDGSFRPLDDRVVKELEGAKCDISKANKKRVRKWRHEHNQMRRTMALMMEYGHLKDVREKRLKYSEESPALDKRIDDIAQELGTLHGSDDAIRHSAKLMVRVLSGQVSVGAVGNKQMKGTKLWTPGC